LQKGLCRGILLCMKNKKFGICYNPNIDRAAEVQKVLSTKLAEYDVSVSVSDIDNLKSGVDFVFVIGGDGTILKSARFYAAFGTPIFGVNLGRLGFLSQTPEKMLSESVNQIMAGEYFTEDRIMLKAGASTALNDIVIKSSASGRTSRFSLKINDEAVCDYLADGIIISTPTGSTAYGLSAGGPVLVPGLNAFVIVPICPHTLTARPLVVPDCEKITVCGREKDKKYVISADGQEFYEAASNIEICKSKYPAKLALLNRSGFYSILRDKLHWGESPAFCS